MIKKIEIRMCRVGIVLLLAHVVMCCVAGCERPNTLTSTERRVNQVKASAYPGLIKEAWAELEERYNEQDLDGKYYRKEAYKLIAFTQILCGEFSQARRMAKNAPGRGSVEYDILQAIVYEWVDTGDFDKAKAAIDLFGPGHGRAETYRSIACYQAKAGQYSDAMATINAIGGRQAHEKAFGFQLVAEIQAGKGDYEQAFKTAAAAEAVDELRGQRALRDIARCQAAAGNLKEAWKTVDRIKSEDVRMDATGRIAQALAESNKPIEACKVADRLTDEDYREEAYVMIVRALAETGRIESASKAMEDMIKVCPDSSYSHDQARVELIQGLAIAGKIERAKALTTQIGKAWDGTTSDFWCTAQNHIAISLTKSQQIKAAYAVADQIPKANARAITYKNIASTLADAGDFKKALATVPHCRQELPMEGVEGVRSLAYECSKALDVIALSMAKQGKIAEALTALLMLPQEGVGFRWTICAISKKMIRMGKDQAVGKWASSVKHPLVRMYIYFGAIQGCIPEEPRKVKIIA